jgi:hypothetical protein
VLNLSRDTDCGRAPSPTNPRAPELPGRAYGWVRHPVCQYEHHDGRCLQRWPRDPGGPGVDVSLYEAVCFSVGHDDVFFRFTPWRRIGSTFYELSTGTFRGSCGAILGFIMQFAPTFTGVFSFGVAVLLPASLAIVSVTENLDAALSVRANIEIMRRIGAPYSVLAAFSFGLYWLGLG